MNIAYHWSAFLEHQQLWNETYHNLKEVSFTVNGKTIAVPVGDSNSPDARALRVRSMLMSLGHADEDAGAMGVRFEFVQMLMAHHVDALQSAGLISFAVPGQIAVVKPEALIAMHLVFQGDPPTKPGEIDIQEVIKDAKNRCAKWVQP